MSARPARTAEGALRDSIAAMNSRQLGLAAREIGVSRATMAAFAEGRTALPTHTLQRLGAYIYRGAYFQKS
jgi:hypothetical protein